MYEGQWTEASEQFARAQTADPARPALFRAKLDALRGMAALRRGEIENCVACCNESSCIFPLAGGRRSSPDRRLARGNRALHALPAPAAGRSGRPVALERRAYDAGRVPERGSS